MQAQDEPQRTLACDPTHKQRLCGDLKLWLMMEGAAVRSSEKICLPLFSFFFIVLIVFAALYSPVDALSRPAGHWEFCRDAGEVGRGTAKQNS
jgi:hypothetical protein